MKRCPCFRASLLGWILAVPMHAEIPAWWTARDVVDAQPVAPGESGHDPSVYDQWMRGNYAPAVLGQAKHFAKQAYREMESQAPGSAGPAMERMIHGFSTSPEDNYVPLLLGQLKAIAQPFYDRFAELDYQPNGIQLHDPASYPYPWNDATPVENNYLPANVGQLKYVFSFELNRWGTGFEPWLGVPDAWKRRIAEFDYYDAISEIEDVLAEDDFDGDGVDNLSEYEARTDPLAPGYSSRPIALIEADPVQGKSPLKVSFDASLSYDPDGSIVGYYWNPSSYYSGPDITTPTFEHTYNVPGSHTVFLAVVDEQGNTGFGRVRIEVIPPPNAVIEYSPSRMGSSPLEIDFDASGSYDGDGGAIVAYAWDFNGDGITDSSAILPPTQTFIESGNHVITLRVTNEAGMVGTKTLTATVFNERSTYPADYEAVIHVLGGDGQIGLPGKFAPLPFRVLITNASGEPLARAPVRFATVDGSARLSTTPGSSDNLKATIQTHTGRDGKVRVHQGAVYFYSPSSVGVTSEVRIIAGNASTTLTTHTTSQLPPQAPTKLQRVRNADGSTTYSWKDNSDNEDAFTIWEQLSNGSFVERATLTVNQNSYTLPAQ